MELWDQDNKIYNKIKFHSMLLIKISQRTILLKILPELNNRRVISVACGDFHTLAVVHGYLPHANLKSLFSLADNFTGYDVFGWGENGCGQICGFKEPNIIYYP